MENPKVESIQTFLTVNGKYLLCPLPLHTSVTAHVFGHEPPQSTPVSSPFLIPSVHVGHFTHEPPQSIPVSSPFLMPSLHVAPLSLFLEQEINAIEMTRIKTNE